MIEDNDSLDNIKTDMCDCCNYRAIGVEFYDRGVPVFFQCKHCGPQAFEAASRKFVDSWLSGARIF